MGIERRRRITVRHAYRYRSLTLSENDTGETQRIEIDICNYFVHMGRQELYSRNKYKENKTKCASQTWRRVKTKKKIEITLVVK